MASRKRLVKYDRLSDTGKSGITGLVGVKNRTPLLYAFVGKEGAWRITPLKKTQAASENRIFPIAEFDTADEVLRCFRKNDLIPYCFKEGRQTAKIAGKPVPATERRKHFRKTVRLHGECVNRRNGERHGIRIENLSFSGAKLILPRPPKTRPADTLFIRFDLDDRKNSRIERRLKPTRIHQHTIAGEFVDPPAYDPKLGFYFLE